MVARHRRSRDQQHLQTEARAVEHILEHGTLARRLVDRLGAAPDREAIRHVYSELAVRLQEDRLFDPDPS